MELPVLNTAGELISQAKASDQVFDVPMNRDLLHQALVFHQANQRQGNSATKTRSMVAGGGRKPFSQKGTGRARQGSIRAPHMRHGGVVFGPHPRDYGKSLPKKMRRHAIRCALSAKVRGERLILIDQLLVEEGKSKAMAGILSALGVNSSALVIIGESNRQISLASRNLPKIKTLTSNLVNVLDLMRYDRVVMTVDALSKIESLWGQNSETVGVA